MTRMDESSRRTQLADRFANYPLLSMFILSPTFPLTLGALLICALLIGLAIPKLWRTSPPGVEPKVKVSLIDLVQASMLGHQARKLEAAGRLEEAQHAWQSAIANNEADIGLLTAALTSFTRISEPPRRMIESAIGQAFWLMRLTNTNSHSLDVVGPVLIKCHAPEITLELLHGRQPPLTPAQETACLKALFLMGKTREFRERREKFGQNLLPDPEFDLFDAADVVVSGQFDKAAEARKKLAQARDDPSLRDMACRLQMTVAAQTQAVALYEEALEHLQESLADTLRDHIGYWRLLEAAGRLADARRLAESYPNPPSNPSDVVQFSSVLVSLGAADHAQRFFARYAPTYANTDNPDVAAIWVAYADLLLQSRKWDDLRTLAAQLRSLYPVRTELTGYSYFLEGRAFLAAGYAEEARASFQRAADQPFRIPAAGMQTARDLLKLGHADLAEKILRPLEESLAKNVDYWQLLFEIAYSLKQDEALLLRAATKTRELQPNKAIYNVNYAAALLINRQNPAEASKITLTFMQSNPDSLVARVNHCFALAMNRRFDEAASLLSSINPAVLTGLEATVYRLCWLEIHVGQQQKDIVREDLKHIDPKHLFPNQVKWIETVRREL